MVKRKNKKENVIIMTKDKKIKISKKVKKAYKNREENKE